MGTSTAGVEFVARKRKGKSEKEVGGGAHVPNAEPGILFLELLRIS